MAAYAQFGYSYPSATQLLVSGQPTTNAGSPVSGGGSLSPGGSAGLPGTLSPGGGSSGGPGPCCESGRPIMTDSVTGQTVCSCQYDSARLAALQYPRSVSMYGAPYPSTDQNPYPSIGVETSAFYSPLVNIGCLGDRNPDNSVAINPVISPTSNPQFSRSIISAIRKNRENSPVNHKINMEARRRRILP
ncbi:hypothetical protein WA026_020410 [Henosepilachna vigintioctopunctata]|uniref:Uncharacterized protein n=1 Tax=Henosepilachna vigintioctopunctata TaxID=420089 RepID=A0AAW1UMJ4_9CUCU